MSTETIHEKTCPSNVAEPPCERSEEFYVLCQKKLFTRKHGPQCSRGMPILTLHSLVEERYVLG